MHFQNLYISEKQKEKFWKAFSWESSNLEYQTAVAHFEYAVIVSVLSINSKGLLIERSAGLLIMQAAVADVLISSRSGY